MIPSPPSRRVRIIAHRGYSAAAPENTLVAVEAAATAGAHAVEWDVRVLACGTPVLFHDDTLDRTTDRSGPVDSHSHAEVRQADAGSWFSDAFRGERIPTLAEAMDFARGRFERVYPEIKAHRNDGDLDRIGEIVRESGMSSQTTFISMDWTALQRLRVRDDAVKIGYIVEDAGRISASLERAAGDPRAILDPDFRLILERPEFAAAAMQRGIEVATWTVNTVDDANALAARGVTGFTTDHVTRLLRWSQALPEPAA